MNRPNKSAWHPLSPLQEGMLFHSLLARQAGVDIAQILCDWREEVDEPAFNQAWQRLAERHSILRTSFSWEGQESPRQRVHERVEIPVRQKDWQGLSEQARDERLRELLEADLQTGLQLENPPLMRVTLIRRGPKHFQFVWTVHHLLVDARSLVILLDDLFKLHQSILSGHEPPWKPAPDHREFINWLRGQDGSEAEGFWRDRLEGFTEPTPLPARAGGSKGVSPGGCRAEEELVLSGDTVRDLRELAKAHGLTLNTLLQGAWGVVLSRHGGEEDVVFGAVKACRHLPVPGVEEMAGPLINTLPMRVRCAADQTLIEWLKAIREQWVELRPFEHSPLVKVQSWSQVPAGRPLFETILNVQDPPWDTVLQESWSGRDFRIRNQPNYPLALDVYAGGSARLTLIYDPGMFERPAMRRMLGHVRTVLESMARAPQQRVGDLPLLTEAERNELLEKWNETERNYPEADCVHRLVEAQAKRNPEALAVSSERVRLSYRQLDERASRVARRLREIGVGPGARVGICMERSAENVIGLLGILKAGGAYVPLDPEYPADRLAFMIQDAKMRVLLTQSRKAGWKAGLPDVGARVICFEEMEAESEGTDEGGLPAPADSDESDPNARATLGSLAYVIYTSGSTGTPKGVEIEHRGLLNLIRWHQERYEVRPEDRATQLASLAFDASVWELWPYLTAGASVHLPDEETRLNPGSLARWLADEKITLTFVPTPLAEAMMDGPWPEGIALRALLTGGDRLHRGPREKLPFQLVNHYGPTENSVVTTSAVVPSGGESREAPPIGRPIANTRLYVLDARMRPVPVGVPGELHIAGAGLARGYLNRPELTEEKFVANPFCGGPFNRLYRTGDRVRYREDGNVEFLGRIDQQVKVRGYRIELGEIEAVLGGHPDVREAVVVAHQNGATRLAAYIVADQRKVPTAPQLRDCLKQKLPEHMIPSAFVFLDALPLTPNGKVDRKALPAPEFESPAQDFVPPRNQVEEVLAGIWRELLQVRRVGVRENFFELGGHSLLGTQVISRVRNVFGVELPLHAVFEEPTIERFAKRLKRVGGDPGRSSPIARKAEARRDGEVDLSFGQERLWFMEQLEPGLAVFNVPIGISLNGSLNVAALEQSLNALAARHGSLRTGFVDSQGRPKARRVSEVRVALPVIDLEGLSNGEQQSRVERVMTEEAAQPFDLSHAPLLRTKLLRLGGRKHLLLLTTHHIVSDGWSMSILHRELREFYEACARDGNASLPELPLEFDDYAAWQRGWLQGEALDEQLAYWKRRLQGPLPALDLPSDHPRPARQSHRGKVEGFSIDNSLREALKALCHREDVTLFMLLLAAFQTLLHRYSGQEDIVTGTTVAGRTRSEIESLTGLFMNTLALRTALSGELTFRGLLRRVRQAALEAYAHQDVPFEKVVEALGVERDLSRSPVFQVMFVLQKAPLPSVRAGDLEWSAVPMHSGTSKFDLTLSMEEGAEGLSGYVEYDCDLFDPDTIVRLLGHFQTLLQGVVENPEGKLSELPLLTGSEREQLLVEWNRTDACFPRESCLHQLFEQQAARTPDAVAVISEDRRLTYQELDDRANALAARLQALGVGPEVPVGLCVNRSPDLLTGLLGILKAGGCYVPLDPAHPGERLAFILQDCQATVLLTQTSLRDHLKFEISNLRSLCLDAMEETPAHSNLKSQISNLKSSDPAYVIYTSGSTGQPKGVAVPHRAVVNFLTSMARQPGLDPRDVLVAVTTLSFDIAVLELLLPLTRGATVVIASHDEAVDGHALRSLLERHRATVMQATPVTWRLLLEAGWTAEVPSADNLVRAPAGKGFKALMGGEAMPRDLADQLLARGAELWNLYGPTETTVWSTCARITDPSRGITIGRPIANTTIRLLDKQGHLCPIGVPGELCIGGEGVALGYWNRPELTADRFIQDPFSPAPEARLYRTGDLARWRPDGTLEHLGRLDFQVKLRGFRIEPGEIEAGIAQHPAVREVAVVAREDTPGDGRLVAYVVAQDPPADLTGQLRARVRQAMPEYMVPARFVLLETLPRTANGKLDRRALPAPDEGEEAPRDAAVSPRTPTEQRVLEVFAGVLGRIDVGVFDNFFDLGGHSLMAARLMAKLRAESGVDLPLRELFAQPTVAGLAAAIDALQWVRPSTTPDNSAGIREEIVL